LGRNPGGGVTNILEELAASIFLVSVCRKRNKLYYIGKLQGGSSLRSVGADRNLSGPIGTVNRQMAIFRAKTYHHGKGMEL
jgi:hypothetical protein